MWTGISTSHLKCYINNDINDLFIYLFSLKMTTRGNVLCGCHFSVIIKSEQAAGI